MNKENAKEYLPLVQALAKGKTVQWKLHGIWKDPLDLSFGLEAHQYRIKPEPRTFVFLRNKYSGQVIRDKAAVGDGWERITVREVLE